MEEEAGGRVTTVWQLYGIFVVCRLERGDAQGDTGARALRTGVCGVKG